ncbi:hypothetical protein [Bacillus horti]|uniref:NTP pyrophosphatase (Non-canonical NTP hydrolase) n=1 Tax=Caldalkalibacillus horti TaxID=77523 RepID=A0ABT9VWA7_9BACI|nr:hypothetical protein [Bacillus horti]MDQ0165278.1 NTP pyrophosphatase (non-canonical NTP hydrolase) [Bacillus horti]
MKTIAYYQESIDSAIQALGGYWRPLSSLARLLEEIGEVNELLLQETRDMAWKEELAAELTDLFFISTCLAHQYAAQLENEYKRIHCPVVPEEMYAELDQFETPIQGLLHVTAQSGQIARILNHYEGDKKKKPSEQHKSVATEVAHLHKLLIKLANTVEVKLFDHVEVIISRNLVRDKNRFDITHDPITEGSRAEYLQALNENGQDNTPKVWGANAWDSQKTIEENILHSLPTIKRWVKCGQAEGIEAVVFQLPGKLKEADHIIITQRMIDFIGSNIDSQIELTATTYIPQANEHVFVLLKRMNRYSNIRKMDGRK